MVEGTNSLRKPEFRTGDGFAAALNESDNVDIRIDDNSALTWRI